MNKTRTRASSGDSLLAEAAGGYFMATWQTGCFGAGGQTREVWGGGQKQQVKQLLFFQNARERFQFYRHRKRVMRILMRMRTIVNKYF
jgi:hypothetical protein